MIVKMDLWHILYVATNLRAADAVEFEAVDGGDLQAAAARQYLKPGMHFAALGNDGIPVCCFGFNEETKSIATMWMLSTDIMPSRIKSIVSAARGVMGKWFWERHQAYINPADKTAVRFIEWLGLSLDGKLPGVRPDGGAMLLYSHTKAGG